MTTDQCIKDFFTTIYPNSPHFIIWRESHLQVKHCHKITGGELLIVTDNSQKEGAKFALYFDDFKSLKGNYQLVFRSWE